MVGSTICQQLYKYIDQLRDEDVMIIWLYVWHMIICLPDLWLYNYKIFIVHTALIPAQMRMSTVLCQLLSYIRRSTILSTIVQHTLISAQMRMSWLGKGLISLSRAAQAEEEEEKTWWLLNRKHCFSPQDVFLLAAFLESFTWTNNISSITVIVRTGKGLISLSHAAQAELEEKPDSCCSTDQPKDNDNHKNKDKDKDRDKYSTKAVYSSSEGWKKKTSAVQQKISKKFLLPLVVCCVSFALNK